MNKHRILALYTYMVLIILLLTHISFLVSAYHLIEYWDGSTNTDVMIYGNNWRGETFTLGTTGENVNYELSSVRLYLWKAGTPNGYSVRIRATSSGLPTGADLSIAWFDGNSLTTSGAYYNHTIPSITLNSSTTYAIIVSCNGSSTGNSLKTRLRNAGEDYSGGGSLYSTNAGASFSLSSTNSIPFYVWGIYAIKSFNITYYNFSIVNNSFINKTVDYNIISYFYNQTLTNYVNVSFNKTCLEGYNTVTTLYCNGISLGSNTWINGSRTYNMINGIKSLKDETTYKIFFNTTYLDLLYSEYYNIIFNVTVINLPIINSTCGNTSLTVYNNTINTTGKYETSYNSSTGNFIWMNYTGFGGGNITGYTEADLFLIGYSVFILSATGFLMLRYRRKKQ